MRHVLKCQNLEVKVWSSEDEGFNPSAEGLSLDLLMLNVLQAGQDTFLLVWRQKKPLSFLVHMLFTQSCWQPSAYSSPGDFLVMFSKQWLEKRWSGGWMRWHQHTKATVGTSSLHVQQAPDPPLLPWQTRCFQMEFSPSQPRWKSQVCWALCWACGLGECRDHPWAFTPQHKAARRKQNLWGVGRGKGDKPWGVLRQYFERQVG